MRRDFNNYMESRAITEHRVLRRCCKNRNRITILMYIWILFVCSLTVRDGIGTSGGSWCSQRCRSVLHAAHVLQSLRLSLVSFIYYIICIDLVIYVIMSVRSMFEECLIRYFLFSEIYTLHVS